MRLILTLLTLVLTPLPAWAWSNQGHMATGLIAFYRLRIVDPAAITEIARIMAAHPQAAGFARVMGSGTADERHQRLFMAMARWPDDIRGTSYDRPKWHYQGAVVRGWTGLRFEVGGAARAFAQVRATAADPRAPFADRAIALCWLFHITGDMHQPLHAGHRMDARFAMTDRMGTIGHVGQADDSDQTLHQLWDHALDRPDQSDRQGAMTILQAAILARLPLDQRVGDLARWTAESRVLARDVAYDRDLDEASPVGRLRPVSARYLARMRVVALRRVAVAGARLSKVLAAMLP